MSFRKSSVVVIDCGRRVVRAGRGLGEELLPAPTIEFAARVGVRKDAMQIDGALRPGRPKWSNFLVGTSLDQAEAAGETLDIFWPFDDSDIKLWDHAEAIWRYVLFTALQLRRTQNEYPLMLSILPLMSRVSHERIAQICFEHLNVTSLAVFDRPLLQLFSANAVSGTVIDISAGCTDVTPIIDSELIRHGIQTIPIGMHACETYLLNILKRNSNLLDVLNDASPLSPSDLDAALLTLIRKAWTDGVIHVPAQDGAIPAMPTEDPAGIEDIAAVMVSGKEKAIIEAAAKKKTTAQEKKAAATAAAEKERAEKDLVDIEFSFKPSDEEEARSYKVTLGRERHQLCDPLFDPSVILRAGEGVLEEEERRRIAAKPVGLLDAVRNGIHVLDPLVRLHAWGGIFLTGDAPTKNLEAALQSRLQTLLIRDPESQLQVQPIALRMVKVPEYFAEYRDRGSPIASFLGASIVAKLTFTQSDSSGGKSFITKSDYGERGPTAIRALIT